MAEKFNTVMVNKDGLVKYPSSGSLTIPADLTLDTPNGNFVLSDSTVLLGQGNVNITKYDVTIGKSISFSDNALFYGGAYFNNGINVSPSASIDIGPCAFTPTHVSFGSSGAITFDDTDHPGLKFISFSNIYFGDGYNNYFDATNNKFVFDVAEINDPTLCGQQISSITTSGISNRADSLVTESAVKSYVDSKIQPSLDDGWITGFTDHYNTPTLTTTNFPTITNGNLTVSFKAKHEAYVYEYNGFALTLYDNYGHKITGKGSSRVYSMNGINIIYGYDLTSNYDGNQTTWNQTHTFTVKIGDSAVTGSTSSAVSKNYQLTRLVYAPGSSTSGVEAEDLSFVLHIGNTVIDGLIPITLTVNNSSNNVTITQSNNSYSMTSATWGSAANVPRMSMSGNGSGYGKFMMKDIKIGSIELANYISDRGNSMDSSATEISFFKWYDKNDSTRYITGTYYDTLAEWQIHGTNDYLLEPYKTLPFISSNATELKLKKLQIVSDVEYFNPLIISHISNDDNSYGGYLQNVLKIDMSANYEKSLISGAAEITGYNNFYTLTSKNSYGELKLTGSGAVLQVGDEHYEKLKVDGNEAKFGVPFKAPVYEITSSGSYNKLDEEVSFRVVKQNGNYTIVIDPPSA